MADRGTSAERDGVRWQDYLADMAAANEETQRRQELVSEALDKVDKSLDLKPSTVTSTRQFSWTSLLPFALAYLGVLGYAMSCAYMKGFYGQLLPGLPIAFPFVDTLSALVGYPLSASLAIAGGLIWPYLSQTSITLEYRESVGHVVVALEDARLEVVASRKAEKRLDSIVKPSFEGMASQTVPPMTAEDRLRLRDEITKTRSRIRSHIATLRTFEKTLRQQRWRFVLSAPFDWRPALWAMSGSSRWRQLVVVPGMGLLPFALLSPIALLWLSDAYRMTLAVDFLLIVGVSVGLLAWVCGWRGTSVLPRISGELQTAARLSLALFAILFMVAASWCVGLNRAHLVAAGNRLPTVTIELRDGTSASGRSVAVIDSDTYYLLQDSSRLEHSYRIVQPDDVKSVTFSRE